MRLNRRLDGARFERDLTLKELALMAEVPLRHVQEACGRRDVERLTMRSALRLCEVLDHTLSMQVVRNEKRLSTGEAVETIFGHHVHQVPGGSPEGE